MEEQDETGWYQPEEFRMYDPEIGRFLMIDPVIKHHESVYAWNTNNPISFADPLGSDSTQRANAVQQMQNHIDQGTEYNWDISASTAPNGNAPGEAGNCSSTVSNCVVAGGESNPSDVTPSGDQGSGVLNIEGNTQSVNSSDAQSGNIVTFRMPGDGYEYHTGLVMETSTDADGNTVITFGHNSSGNGAQSETFTLGSGQGWDANSPSFYKWDTKPDVNRNQPPAQKNTSNSQWVRVPSFKLFGIQFTKQAIAPKR